MPFAVYLAPLASHGVPRCGSNAKTRWLTGNPPPTGVKSYEVSLEKQEAVVVAEPTLPYETVLKTIAKTGKKVNSGEADGEAKSVEVPAEA